MLAIEHKDTHINGTADSDLTGRQRLRDATALPPYGRSILWRSPTILFSPLFQQRALRKSSRLFDPFPCDAVTFSQRQSSNPQPAMRKKPARSARPATLSFCMLGNIALTAVHGAVRLAGGGVSGGAGRSC